jgi:hypothetical protein
MSAPDHERFQEARSASTGIWISRRSSHSHASTDSRMSDHSRLISSDRPGMIYRGGSGGLLDAVRNLPRASSGRRRYNVEKRLNGPEVRLHQQFMSRGNRSLAIQWTNVSIQRPCRTLRQIEPLDSRRDGRGRSRISRIQPMSNGKDLAVGHRSC